MGRVKSSSAVPQSEFISLTAGTQSCSQLLKAGGAPVPSFCCAGVRLSHFGELRISPFLLSSQLVQHGEGAARHSSQGRNITYCLFRVGKI